MKFVALALTLLMGISFTSCLNSDDDSSSQGGGIVTVINSYGSVYFLDGSGVKYYPTSTSLASVESTYSFSTSSKVAYVVFDYDTTTETASTGYTVELTYAVSLDSKVEMVQTKGASNDSTTTAPVISLDLMTTSEYLYVINDQLVIGANYYMSKYHYLTMVYYPNETTESSTEIKLYLRHNSKGDTSTAATSYDYASSYPSIYFKAYNLSNILNDFYDKTGLSSVKINVETKENDSSIDLTSATTKNYTLTYSFDN